MLSGLLFVCAGAAYADTWHNGDLTTYTADNWGGNPNLDAGAALLTASYDTIYTATFGVVTVGSTSGFTMQFTDAASALAYMPAIGPFAPLTGNVLDPLSTTSGAFGSEVLGLQFNVDFSDAGFLPGTSGLRFGDLVLENFSSSSAFNGLTVRQFLGDLNVLLGGGATAFTIAGLGTTVGDVNASFSAGNPSSFAQEHLVAPVSRSTVPEPSNWILLAAAVIALACSRRPKGVRNVMSHSRKLLVLALASACAGVAHADTWQTGDLTTYNQNEWGGDPGIQAGAALMNSSFNTVYGASFGVLVGSISQYTLFLTDAASVFAYLPAIGPYAPLNGSTLDPITTASGALGGETLGLAFNVDFSDAGLLPAASGLRFGDLVLENFDLFSGLNGLTVRQLLADANQVLGGASTIFNPVDLGQTLNQINGSFFEGTPSAFAQAHLAAPTPTSTVPEPSSLMLLVTALAGLRLSRRRCG